MTSDERYRYRVDNALCVKCAEPIDPSKGRECPTCAKIRRIKDGEKRAGWSDEYKAKLKAYQKAWREAHRDYGRNLYRKYKEQGLCVQCRRPTNNGKARCEECLGYQKTLWDSRGIDHGAKQRKEA